MKTTLQKVYRIALPAILLAVLLAVVGCDKGETGPTAAEQRDDEVNLTVDVFDNGQQAVLFSAHGAVTDQGPVEGFVPEESNGMWSGYVVLQGGKGEVFVDVDAVAHPGNGNLAEGTYAIRSGTGLYEDIEGCGKYRAFRDPNGRLIQQFTGCCNKCYR